MDGLGRMYENIFVERLCWTVKYEEVYLHEYRTVTEDRQSLSIYFALLQHRAVVSELI